MQALFCLCFACQTPYCPEKEPWIHLGLKTKNEDAMSMKCNTCNSKAYSLCVFLVCWSITVPTSYERPPLSKGQVRHSFWKKSGRSVLNSSSRFAKQGSTIHVHRILGKRDNKQGRRDYTLPSLYERISEINFDNKQGLRDYTQSKKGKTPI